MSQKCSPPSSSMSTPSFSENVEGTATIRVPIFRPRSALLKVLHLAGGVGETFTMGEIICHVKEYIGARTLYNEQDPRVVHCRGDLLADALRVDTFTVHEAINLFRKNCTVEPDSCIRIYRHLVTRAASSQQLATASTAAEASTAPAATGGAAGEATAGQHAGTETSEGMQISAQGQSSSRHEITDKFNGGEKPCSSGIQAQVNNTAINVSCDEPDGMSHSCKSGTQSQINNTAINVSYDEPDGMSDPWTCQVTMKTSTEGMTRPEDDTVVVEFDSDEFSVEYDIQSSSETDDSKKTFVQTDESSSASGTAILFVCQESDVEYLADYSDSNSESDAELSHADKWQCQQCQEKNLPFQRNCGGCWVVRPDWLPGDGDGLRLASSFSLPDGSDSFCVQAGNDKDSMELNNPKASLVKEKMLGKKRRHSTSLSSSDSQAGQINEETVSVVQPSPSNVHKSCCNKKSFVPRRDDSVCIVCLERKKTASIIHGKTGHQVCCYRCARKLKKQRKSCPICRRPIQKVIRNFHL